MKKAIYKLMGCFIALLAVTLTACEDETSQDISTITYYINFELEGDETMYLPVGTAYVEPGFTAMEGDQDVTSSVVTSGSVDGNTVGLYTITYSAVNQDGFSSSTSRTVIVYDPTVTLDISGTYTTAEGSYRLVSASNYTEEQLAEMTVVEYAGEQWVQSAFSGYTVTLSQLAAGFYNMSDYLGGYYAQGAGYGAAYAMTGYLKQNADNTLEILSGNVAGWGDSYSAMENLVYDETTGDISYILTYADMLFFITLTK